MKSLLAGAIIVAGFVTMVAAAAAAVDRKAPRIVAARLIDADSDFRADRARVSFSKRVRHVADRDGRYPFTVAGYRIRSVGAASGKTILLLLVEKATPDPNARPAIRYRRTTKQRVRDLAGNQALAQNFRGTRAHGNAPNNPPPPPTPTDSDGDGTLDTQDCAPQNAAVHPKAADLPDLAFIDANCDGLDGTETNAVFASPLGKDTNSGTKAAPKRQIQAAVAAAGQGRYVLAAAGAYTHVEARSGVDVYGGYDPADWSTRKSTLTAQIVGSPEGLLADGATDITLQQLSIRGLDNGASAYGVRAINNSRLRLQGVTITVGDAAAGAAGTNGAAGLDGSPGLQGKRGACDSNVKAPGGAGGNSPVSRDGGKGGDGKYESRGGDGAAGLVGTPGGKGGVVKVNFSSPLDRFGKPGQSGTSGAPGSRGSGGANSTELAATTWRGRGGIDGIYGAPGNGGGGGGAGGGQTGALVINGTGNGGGGGGGGAAGGRGGEGGGPGGGSFGVYLSSSTLVVEKSSITAGNGGQGGRGGSGGPGGTGGGGGEYTFYCNAEISASGRGGRGGNGGSGGGGGGGAGGASIGIFKLGGDAAKVTLTDTKVLPGTAGAGGNAGAGGLGGAASEPGIAQAIYP